MPSPVHRTVLRLGCTLVLTLGSACSPFAGYHSQELPIDGDAGVDSGAQDAAATSGDGDADKSGSRDAGVGAQYPTDEHDIKCSASCDAHATCITSGHIAACKCNGGYAGSGTACNDVDECLTNHAGCNTKYTTCKNTPGSFACEDIDECLSNNGGCGNPVLWTCTNKHGAAPVCNDVDGNAVATLTDGAPLASGYDFTTRTYTGSSGGDFYFSAGGFWANNPPQRGVVPIGPCSSLSDLTQPAPDSGFATQGVMATAGNCYAALSQGEGHDTILFRVDDVNSKTATLTWKLVDYCHGYSSPRQNINCWLLQNPNIAKYLVWEERVSLGQATATPWSAWTNARRDELRDNVRSYTKVLTNVSAVDPDPLTDPPVNQEALLDTAFPVGVLSSTDAWRLYVKTVAMSLAVELDQYVPWSVTSYDAESLASLFDSRHLVSYTWSNRAADLGMPTPSSEGYVLVSDNYDSATHLTFTPYFSYVTPAPPTKTLAFLLGQNLIGTSRLQTIINALTWARRLHPFTGSRSAKVFEAHWQYRGPAPVSRTIDATTKTGDSTALHYNAESHGMSGLLRSVLRTVNIPVDNDKVGLDSVTRFMTEDVYLSDGEDPYIGEDIYGVPVSETLISDTTYTAWFVSATPTLRSENLGRANIEAMIEHLSGKLQYEYCNDPVPGADHSNSLIITDSAIAIRPDVYPLSYLENLPPDPANASLPASLWDRLAQKIADQGGCTTSMNVLDQQMSACFAVTPVSERLDCNW